MQATALRLIKDNSLVWNWEIQLPTTTEWQDPLCSKAKWELERNLICKMDTENNLSLAINALSLIQLSRWCDTVQLTPRFKLFVNRQGFLRSIFSASTPTPIITTVYKCWCRTLWPCLTRDIRVEFQATLFHIWIQRCHQRGLEWLLTSMHVIDSHKLQWIPDTGFTVADW